MSHHRALKQSGLGVAALALLLAGFESLSYGVGCLPATPNPCAADGICRPNRDSWGHYKTRWRTWPGEPMGQQPTPADPTGDAEDEQALPPYEAPPAEQEDLRGPAKEKAAKAPKADEGEAPAEPAGELDPFLPGPAEVPAFDPLGNQLPPGNQLEIPPLEDTPPTLPKSLRQAALSQENPTLGTTTPNMPAIAARQQPPATRSQVPQAIATQPIRPAGWQEPAIGLINPASAIVAEPETNSLQQAIYYEASDLDDE